MFIIGPHLYPPPSKNPQTLPHGKLISQFKTSTSVHYVHNNNALSLSPTTVKVQKKIL